MHSTQDHKNSGLFSWLETQKIAGTTKHYKYSTKDHGTQMAMPEILSRGVENKLRQREEKIQKEDMTILPLIDVALETAVLELAASKVAPIARLLRRNGVNIATCWQSKNYGFVWWVTAANLQFQTIKDAIRDINCLGITVDETTDCGVQKQLIVYLKTQHHASQRFLGIVSMEGSKSVDIVEAVVSILKRYDLDITKLASVSFEGCSTIRGAVNGVIVRMNRIINFKVNPDLGEDCGESRIFAAHCVLHRLNLSLNDVFVSEDAPNVVNILADKIELVVEYVHNWFARSLESRHQYEKLIDVFTRAEIPGSWNDTRLLFRHPAIRAVVRSHRATVSFIDENDKVRTSLEGCFVRGSLTDDDFLSEMGTVRKAVGIMFTLSKFLQASVQTPWEAFLLIQIGVGRLSDLLDNVPKTKSVVAVKLLIHTLMNSVNKRIPVSEGKMIAIYDSVY